MLSLWSVKLGCEFIVIQCRGTGAQSEKALVLLILRTFAEVFEYESKSVMAMDESAAVLFFFFFFFFFFFWGGGVLWLSLLNQLFSLIKKPT